MGWNNNAEVNFELYKSLWSGLQKSDQQPRLMLKTLIYFTSILLSGLAVFISDSTEFSRAPLAAPKETT